MKIKNTLIELLLIQLSGTGIKKGTEEHVAVGLLNFDQGVEYGMKGKLRRSLLSLNKTITDHYDIILQEKNRINNIKDDKLKQEELEDLSSDTLLILGWEVMPLSWLDDIKISNVINTDFLLEIGVFFDDTTKITSSINKKEIME